MKKLALTSLGFVAALCGSCSSEPKSKKESARLPTPYIETRPSISESASNPEGGLVPGKLPNEIDVSPTVDPNAPILKPIDLKAGSIAGISLDNTVQEIINVLGKPRVIDDTDSTLYFFEDDGIFVGLSKEAKNGLSEKPGFVYTTTWMGYKGSLSVPESLGKVGIGKKLLDGKVNSTVMREQVVRALGAQIAGAPDPDQYDCFLAGTCVLQPSGSNFAAAFPRALVILTPEGVVQAVELDQAPRQIRKAPAPTQSLQYGKSFAGLSLNATEKDFAATFGPAEVVDGVSYYQKKTVEVLRDAQGQLVNFAVTADYNGVMLKGNGSVGGIQLGAPVDGDFSCENLVNKSVAAFDKTANMNLVNCEKNEGQIAVLLPGTVLIFSQVAVPQSENKATILTNAALQLRPIVYGDSIGGLKLGLKFNELGAVYGNFKSADEVQPGIYKVTYVDGLSVMFDDAGNQVIGVEATSKYAAPVLDAAITKVAAVLGIPSKDLNFNTEPAADASFKALAVLLEGGYQKLAKGAPTDDSAPPVPEFNADTECSFARIKTPTCYFETKILDGVQTYSVALPHMGFEFDSSSTLTRVSL